MFKIYQRLKWIYQKFKLSAWMPFMALVAYTVLGGFIFRLFELAPDNDRREHYRNQTVFAMEQVLDRMLEVRCHDYLVKADRSLQINHAKEAILWFLEHLNLTAVIEERTDDTPWSWYGAMFYAGQLYTTIGYGYPTTRTTGGRVASIFYILVGIPIFLIILKDMGSLLSRALRKIYKRIRTSKRKIAQTAPIRKFSFSLFNIYKTDEKGDIEKNRELDAIKQNAINAKISRAENSFPISIALTILILWILFSAALFCIWEREWGFMTSVYFFFVSISTVGLGDIVFSNPDMMIYNFALILVGLALLSMCFNLIQAALERLLNRLLDEYIEEIEKMAEIVTNDDGFHEEAIPLEFKMTGNLLTLPMKRVTSNTGFMAEAKGWMAGRIANNLLSSRLGGVTEESDSEKEESEEVEEVKESAVQFATPTTHMLQTQEGVQSRRSSRASATSSYKAKFGSNLTPRNPVRSKPLLNTIRTLERIKPSNNDFKAMIFSKFVQSDQLNRIVDDARLHPKKAMTTVSCQTDVSSVVEEREKKARRSLRNQYSTSSFSNTNSMFANDDESLMSAAFCDIKFDYGTEDAQTPPSVHRRNSDQSILRLDDEDMIPGMHKMAGFNSATPGLPPAPWKATQGVPAVHEPKQNNRPLPSLCVSPDSITSPDAESEVPFEKVHMSYGLASPDFESPSVSTSTSMADSGFETSRRDDKVREAKLVCRSEGDQIPEEV